jgi:hypothetical protein
MLFCELAVSSGVLFLAASIQDFQEGLGSKNKIPQFIEYLSRNSAVHLTVKWVKHEVTIVLINQGFSQLCAKGEVLAGRTDVVEVALHGGVMAQHFSLPKLSYCLSGGPRQVPVVLLDGIPAERLEVLESLANNQIGREIGGTLPEELAGGALTLEIAGDGGVNGLHAEERVH